jgi:hypothetical protein
MVFKWAVRQWLSREQSQEMLGVDVRLGSKADIGAFTSGAEPILIFYQRKSGSTSASTEPSGCRNRLTNNQTMRAHQPQPWCRYLRLLSITGTKFRGLPEDLFLIRERPIDRSTVLIAVQNPRSVVLTRVSRRW